MRISLAVCLSVALIISAPAAFADSKPLRIGKVLAEQGQLRLELEAGSGRAVNVAPGKRADVLARQQELLDMLDGKKAASELTEQQLVFAHNTLAWIEAMVENDDDERVVCRREKTIGSNMVTRVCRTLGQMKIDQERARQSVLSGASRGI